MLRDEHGYAPAVSRKQIDATIAELKAFVGETVQRGVILEAARTAPRGANLDIWKARVGIWHRPVKPPRGKLLPFLPPDYVHFLRTYGSLTWLAPEADPPDGWFYLGNQAAKALLDVRAYDACYDVNEPAEAIGLEDADGLDRIHVFQDGFNRGFAFDARRARGSGEPAVVPFVEDEIEAFLARKPRSVGSFADWLATTARRHMKALGNRTADEHVGDVSVPTNVRIPKGKRLGDTDALDPILQKGWELLEHKKFAAASKAAFAMIEREPLFLYAYSQALDGMVGEDKKQHRASIWRTAWQLLALARRGVGDNIHETFLQLYRQKAATMLADLALVDPSLVSIADAKRLIAEALAQPVGKSDQMFMTGAWDSRKVKAALAKRNK